jgi:cyclophilin family peptidyl-prolyl cis-trans isomerase
MNWTVAGFTLLIVLGLGGLILFSNLGAKDTSGPNLNIVNTNNQQEVKVPQVGSPTPTLAHITATKAYIKTAKGNIDIVLYPNDAPRTVTNFATLAKNKYYDGLTFHRVEPGFVIQGGDPNGNGTGGTSIYGGPFEDEINPESPLYQTGYVEGVVAMANSGPNTNGSQFFIMWEDHADLPKNYTIFGKVIQGMETVHKMVAGDKIHSITVE